MRANPCCCALLPCHYSLHLPQLYTQVEAFASAINELQELGFQVNKEESELVYRGTAGVCACLCVCARLCISKRGCGWVRVGG